LCDLFEEKEGLSHIVQIGNMEIIIFFFF